MKEALILDSFDRYDERTKYVKDALISFGYKVIIIQSDFCHIRKDYIENKESDVYYVHAKKYSKNLSIKRILSHLNVGKKIIKVAEKFSPDIVYCLLPVNNIAKRAKKYAKRKGARLFFDIFDLWPESMPIGNKIIKKMLFSWKNLRDKNLSYAEKVFLECSFYERFLPKSNKYVTAYLCKGEKARELTYSHEENLRFLYLGSVNSLIDIDATMQFLRKVKENRTIEFVLIGGGESKDNLLNSLQNAEINCIDCGMIFDENEKDKIISSCHFGLNIYKESTTIGLTLKSMDYFCRGLPIVTKGIADTKLICDKYKCGISIQESNCFDEALINDLNENSWESLSKNATFAYNDLFTYKTFLTTLEEVMVKQK